MVFSHSNTSWPLQQDALGTWACDLECNQQRHHFDAMRPPINEIPIEQIHRPTGPREALLLNDIQQVLNEGMVVMGHKPGQNAAADRRTRRPDLTRTGVI